MALPVAAMLAVGLWGLDRGGMWRDEAVTFQVARRSVAQIWRLVQSVDAVHGLYYLLVRPVLALHPGEVVLRLPSVCAAAATAGLVAALGVRLARPRVGLWAGLLYAATPLAGHYAQEGRSYALVAAGAAGATLLLARGMERGAAGPWRRAWAAYGAVVAVTCLLHLFAALLLLAHAVTLALARVPGRVWRGWGVAAGGALLVLAPLALLAQGQAAQVGWLTAPRWGNAERLLRQFAGSSGPVLWTYLALVAVALTGIRRSPLVRVALPLAVVAPAVLMGVSQVRPMYDDRYVLYALAGAPLLAAAGADRVVRALCRPSSRGPRPAVALAGVLAVTLVFAHQLPLHRQHRTLAQRADDLAAVSALASRSLRPGDPVLFLPSIGRRAALAYPKGFRRAWDMALAVPGPQSGTLYGRELAAPELRRRLAGVDRVWVVAESYALGARWRPRDPVERAKLAVVGEQFVPRTREVCGGVTFRLYVRRNADAETPPAPASVPPPPWPPSPPPRPAPR
ncbi:glycosyltransferase family 39 protein [Streptomyces sp. NPDC003362]